MNVNVSSLKNKIQYCGLSLKDFASMLGISNSTLLRKLNEHDGLTFTIEEMHQTCLILNLTNTEACNIFLNK